MWLRRLKHDFSVYLAQYLNDQRARGVRENLALDIMAHFHAVLCFTGMATYRDERMAHLAAMSPGERVLLELRDENEEIAFRMRIRKKIGRIERKDAYDDHHIRPRSLGGSNLSSNKTGLKRSPCHDTTHCNLMAQTPEVAFAAPFGPRLILSPKYQAGAVYTFGEWDELFGAFIVSQMQIDPRFAWSGVAQKVIMNREIQIFRRSLMGR
jgi:hypothetical protein